MLSARTTSTFAAAIFLMQTGLAISADAPATGAPVIRDFVKQTDFRYGAWRSSVIGGGGYIQNVVASPSNPKRFYTYVDVAGLSRSDDGGKTWRMLHGNLPTFSGANCIRGVSVDPRDDKKIIVAVGDRWARRGIFTSEDAGATFTKAQDAQFFGNGNHRGSGFVFDRNPQNPDIIVAGSGGEGVFISKDNGKTWTPTGEKNLFAADIRFDRSNPQRIWHSAGKFKQDQYDCPNGFYRSDDGGTTWNKLSDSAPSEIVQDPKDPKIIYGIFGREIIRRSEDGGATWVDFSDGLIIEKMPAGKWKDNISKSGYSAFGVGPDFIVTCNTRDADFFKLQSGSTKWEKIERKAPEVGDWFHKGGWAFGGNASSITVNPHDPKHWFMTDYFAIYQTFDSGKNWVLTVDGMETTVAHCMLQDPTDPGVMHVGLADVGGFVSTDGGTRFRRASVPNEPELKDADAGGGNLKSMDLNPKLPNRLYGVANRNWFVLWQANQVFISNDRGQTWTRSPMIGLPDTQKQPCSTIVADANDPYTVYLTVSGQIKPNGGGVYKSTDGGARWTWMSQGMPVDKWYFPNEIWAHGPQLASSADGSLVAISKQSNMVHRFDPKTKQWTYADVKRSGMLFSLVADKLKPGRYFIASRDGGLYRSDDGGVNWKTVYNKSTSYVAVDAAVPNRVAAGTMTGIILSTDGGETWKEADMGLPQRVEAIPGFSGERLFAATGGSGVFWMPLSPAGEKSVPAKPLVPVSAPVKGALPQFKGLDAEGGTPDWKVETTAGTASIQADDKMVDKTGQSWRISTDGNEASGQAYLEWPADVWRFRTRGLMRAKGNFSKLDLVVQPLDNAGQPMPEILIRSQKPNNGWWDGIARTVVLPEGAARVRLETRFQGKGDFWLENVQLTIPDNLYPQ